MTRTKYQVFISSTYVDLIEERNHVIKAVLSMGHIPVGMEMFNAADDTQWEIIKRQIDQSDYYTLIVAHRYGSMVRGVSYTEKEYDYAVSQGIPVIGFVIDDHAPWPSDRIEAGDAVRAKLKKFKDKVKKKPVAFWSNGLELGGKFTAAFATLINTNPRPGWVRGTEVSGADVANELGRLSKENAELRDRVAEFEQKPVSVLEEEKVWLQSSANLQVIGDYMFHQNLHPAGNNVRNINKTVPVEWLTIISTLAKKLMFSPSEESIRNGMDGFLQDILALQENLSPGVFRLQSDEPLQTMGIGLVTKDIIEPIAGVVRSSRNWTLTRKGKRLVTEILALEPE